MIIKTLNSGPTGHKEAVVRLAWLAVHCTTEARVAFAGADLVAAFGCPSLAKAIQSFVNGAMLGDVLATADSATQELLIKVAVAPKLYPHTGALESARRLLALRGAETWN